MGRQTGSVQNDKGAFLKDMTSFNGSRIFFIQDLPLYRQKLYETNQMTTTTPKFANGILVKKREANKADITNPFYRKFGLRKDHPTYKNDCGRIGTVIKTEIRDQKRKGRTKPSKVFYCEILWRGREKTEWVIQHRLERVEGL